MEMAYVKGLMKKFDTIKNERRNEQFYKKINGEFRQLDGKAPCKTANNRKIILAEGDSWFNYPVILTDVIDAICMDKDIALYSLANGGGWLLDMLTSKKYVEELSVMYPDYFLISGGGNDIVGANRLAAVIDACGNGGTEYAANPWAQKRIANAQNVFIKRDVARFDNGVQHLSKDFFALLMFFRLQYYYLIKGVLWGGDNEKKQGKFKGMKVITQGYDFPVPSRDKAFGLNPVKWYIPFIRMFLGHGKWLKTPLLMRGIIDPQVQQDTLYAMLYLFNEMMIEMHDWFNTPTETLVFHIDSRETIGPKGWTDELHAQPKHFIDTGNVFLNCIKERTLPDYKHVYVVKNQPK